MNRKKCTHNMILRFCASLPPKMTLISEVECSTMYLLACLLLAGFAKLLLVSWHHVTRFS